MSSCELVVARWMEDLSWRQKLPRELAVKVYDKCATLPDAIPLPNIGREAHTYLHHIVDRWEDLADITFFCQGRPFDHVPDFQKVVRQMMQGDPRVEDFTWMGFVVDEDDGQGKLFRDWSKNDDGRGLDLVGFCRELFQEEPAPEIFPFFLGAHFAVTRDTVQRRPKAFYGHALELSITFPDAAHCFERCWDRVFGVDGIPKALKQLPRPTYLRPVKRLGITWEDVPLRPRYHR